MSGLKKHLRAIVLPPGQGKSYMVSRGLPPHIKEADAVYHCRGNAWLSHLRDEAKESGNWRWYDKSLASELKHRLNDGDIIMLASASLASAMDAEVIGYFVSTEELWKRNLQRRGQKWEKHYECYLEAKSKAFYIYDNLDEMYQDISDLL